MGKTYRSLPYRVEQDYHIYAQEYTSKGEKIVRSEQDRNKYIQDKNGLLILKYCLHFDKPGYQTNGADGGIGGTNGYYYKAKLRKHETPETFNRQFRKYKPDPCMSCFHNHGRMWMLKGNGTKSKHKTKGMRKEREHIELV